MKEDYEVRLRRHEQLKMREAAEAERQAEELRRQAEEEEARRRRDAMARAAQDKCVGDTGGRRGDPACTPVAMWTSMHRTP